MRTISIRLDERTDALLRTLCEQANLSQTDIIKSALDHLARDRRPTPAELAARHELVGAFRSTERDLGEQHSLHLKRRLRDRARKAASTLDG